MSQDRAFFLSERVFSAEKSGKGGERVSAACARQTQINSVRTRVSQKSSVKGPALVKNN